MGHLAVALALQLLIVASTRSWWGGAFGAAAWSISREITQAEYRWIEQYGGGLRANMPWWAGVDPVVWQKLDPWLDWIAPTLLAAGIAFLAARCRIRSAPKGASSGL